MTAFYICIILIGVLMIGVAMIWMVIDKKKARDYRLDLDERRHELQQAIEDAEQLLDELNNFSNYIVTRMEEKQQDVEDVVNLVDEKLDLFDQLKDVYLEVSASDAELTMVNNATEVSLNTDELFDQPVSAIKGKIIPFDEKKRAAIKLCQDGMDSTEIAKMLNMGKGEIELISRMCQ